MIKKNVKGKVIQRLSVSSHLSNSGILIVSEGYLEMTWEGLSHQKEDFCHQLWQYDVVWEIWDNIRCLQKLCRQSFVTIIKAVV